jgi:hypothetical protein
VEFAKHSVTQHSQCSRHIAAGPPGQRIPTHGLFNQFNSIENS